MIRKKSKEHLLPSLLDRLTDDAQVKNLLLLQENRINELDKKLTKLSNETNIKEQSDLDSLRKDLQKQLEHAHANYNYLSKSIGSSNNITECVKRDLDWLLNTCHYTPLEELEDYPDIAHSVLNYGIADLTGKTVSGFDLRNIERIIKKAIIDFEPRIIQKTLVVRMLTDKSSLTHNMVTFEIEGEIWAEPMPLYMHLKTEFELENGSVSVVDFHKG